MKLVVDANILFAALIKNGLTGKLLVDERLQLHAPRTLLAEFAKYEELIHRKTHRNPAEFAQLLTILHERITLHPDLNWNAPDPDDAPYLALAQQLNCPLWSNDKLLKEQTSVDVHTTQEVASYLDL